LVEFLADPDDAKRAIQAIIGPFAGSATAAQRGSLQIFTTSWTGLSVPKG
jgi:hypothetical protein